MGAIGWGLSGCHGLRDAKGFLRGNSPHASAETNLKKLGQYNVPICHWSASNFVELYLIHSFHQPGLEH